MITITDGKMAPFPGGPTQTHSTILVSSLIFALPLWSYLQLDLLHYVLTHFIVHPFLQQHVLPFEHHLPFELSLLQLALLHYVLTHSSYLPSYNNTSFSDSTWCDDNDDDAGVIVKSKEGLVLGAVGVSGASGDEDEECAASGIPSAIEAGEI